MSWPSDKSSDSGWPSFRSTSQHPPAVKIQGSVDGLTNVPCSLLLCTCVLVSIEDAYLGLNIHLHVVWAQIYVPRQVTEDI